MVCSPPGSSVHGILQARILQRVAISFSRISCQPRDHTHISCVSCIDRWILYTKVDQYPCSNRGFPCCAQFGKEMKKLKLYRCSCVSGRAATRLSIQKEEQVGRAFRVVNLLPAPLFPKTEWCCWLEEKTNFSWPFLTSSFTDPFIVYQFHKLSLHLYDMPDIICGEGNGTPLQYSCLENPMGGGAWWAAVHGVARSQTWLSDFPFTFHVHALEKEMATHSSVLAWRIPGLGEPGGLPSMGSHRVGHNWRDLAEAAAADIIWA